MRFTARELVAEAERELKQRERVYPRLIDGGRLSAYRAELQISMQREIILILRELELKERLL